MHSQKPMRGGGDGLFFFHVKRSSGVPPSGDTEKDTVTRVQLPDRVFLTPGLPRSRPVA